MGVDWKKTKGCAILSLSSLSVLLCSNFQYDYTDTQGLCNVDNGRRILNILEKECILVRVSLPAPSQKISSQEIFFPEKNCKNFHASGNGEFNRRVDRFLPLPRICIDSRRAVPLRSSRYYLVRCVHVRSFYSQGRSRKISGDKRD